jgi:hypothetical protein
MLAHKQGPLIPKLRGQFAEFLQRSSLKRLGILYQSTCVGLGYGRLGGYFLELLHSQTNPIRLDYLRNSSPSPG